MCCFATMVFFVVLSSPVKPKKIFDIMKMSLFLYVFFLVLIKNDFPFFITILGIISVIYILVLRKTEISDEIIEMKNKSKDDDGAGGNSMATSKEFDEESIIKTKQNEYDQIDAINNRLFIFIIPTLITGFVIYIGKKKIQYKNKFDIVKLMVGTTTCNAKMVETQTNKISAFKAISALFE
jgi:hypothetical protein